MCRTADRLVAYLKGPEFPLEGGETALHKLRTFFAELQDLGEFHRRVVPDPSGRIPAVPTVPVGVPGIAPGLSGKASAPAPLPRPPPGLSGEERGDEDKPLRRRSRSAKRERRPRTRSSTSSRKRRKRRKKTRSPGRSPEVDKSPRLASPVRAPEESPKKVRKTKEENREAEDEEEKERAHIRDLGPREPREPPPEDLGGRTGVAASSKPDRWQGRIPAHRPEPPPGTGRHYGKWKGPAKERKNDAYWARKRQEASWHRR